MPAYIYDRETWPQFRWDHERLAWQLAFVRHRQGRLIGRMESLGFRAAHRGHTAGPDRGRAQIQRDRRRGAGQGAGSLLHRPSSWHRYWRSDAGRPLR